MTELLETRERAPGREREAPTTRTRSTRIEPETVEDPDSAVASTAGRPPLQQVAQALRAPSRAGTPARGKAPVALRRAQRAYGNRAVRRAVLAMRAGRSLVQFSCTCGGSCPRCLARTAHASEPESLERAVLQRRANGTGDADLALARMDVIPTDSSGEPLDSKTREFMEERFAEDLGDVLVHRDPQAASAAERLGADAFTTDRDIFVAEGRGSPQTDAGKRLLAHEIAHTIQKAHGATPGAPALRTRDAEIGRADDPLEREAEQAADAVMAARPPADLSADRPRTVRGDWRDTARGETARAIPGTARGIQRAPRTELDPTYADTPTAGKLPQPPLFHGQEITIDSDGDQVPDLKLVFRVTEREPEGFRRAKKIQIDLEQVPRKPTDKPGKGSATLGVDPKVDAGTFPSLERAADGGMPAMIEFTAYGGSGAHWVIEVQIETQVDGTPTYRLDTWFPKGWSDIRPSQSGGTLRIPLQRGFLSRHNVFRPGDALRGGADLWSLDVDVGAYADPFRLTFVKPTPGSDVLEIGVAAIEDGKVVDAGGAFKTTLAGKLDVKVLSAAGSTLTLDLDGDGKVDAYVFDRLDEGRDYTSSIQTPDIARFRSHHITVRREPMMLGSGEWGFQVRKGVYEATYQSGARHEVASAAVATAELAGQADAGNYAQQVMRLEQARIDARRSALTQTPPLLRKETLSTFESLANEINAQRTNDALTGKTRRTDAEHRSAVSQAAQAALAELMKEPGVPSARRIGKLDAGTEASGTQHYDNPYTGEDYIGTIGGLMRVSSPTLVWLAKKASEGNWKHVYWHFQQAEDGIDALVAQRYEDAKNIGQAQKIRGIVELAQRLETLGEKTGVTPVYGVFYPKAEFEDEDTGMKSPALRGHPLLLYYFREDGDWKLVDLTRKERTFDYDVEDKGEKVPPHSLFEKLDYKPNFPAGLIYYEIPGPHGRSGRVTCHGGATVADVLAWISGAVAVAGLIALTAGAGSVAVGAIFAVSGVIGAGSAAANIIEAYKHGGVTGAQVTLDAIQIIGSLAGAGAGIAVEVRGATAAVRAGRSGLALETLAKWEGVGRMLKPLTATAAAADVVQFIAFAADVPAAFAAVDAGGGTESDRLRAKVLLAAQLAGIGALTVVSVRGAGKDMLRNAPSRLLIEVVDDVPYVRFMHDVKPGEYEQAVANTLTPAAKKAVGAVEVKTVSAAVMKARTGSPSSRAAVVIEGGKPKVLVLDGVAPGALAEELVHLEQLADPKLGMVAKMLDEATLAKYATLSSADKIKLTKAKLTLEIDAQIRIIKGTQAQIDEALAKGTLQAGSAEANALFRQIDDAWQNLEHLRAKDIELVGVERELKTTKTVSDAGAIEDVPRLMSKTTTSGFDLQANWRTLSRDDFIAAYKARYPNTSLSIDELELRWKQGKRLNPTTWHLGAAERKQVVVAEANRAKTGPETRFEPPPSREMPLSVADQKSWDELIKSRDKWKAERAKLEATGQESEALRQARYELNEASRLIGEFAAVQYVKQKYPKVELPPMYGGGKGTSRPGDFDLVFKYTEGDVTKYIIVEAKGGSGSLGTRTVKQEAVEQGNPKYYRAIVDNMKGGKLGPEAEKVGQALHLAPPADVTYLLVKSPFSSSEKTVVSAIKGSEFQ